MRRREPRTDPVRDRTTDYSIGEMKQEAADHARDAKKEGAMCASGLCRTSHNLEYQEERGPYGGHMYCPEHRDEEDDA